jgi:protein-S-isoprenylcysteine O-methyltransferase Ste14
VAYLISWLILSALLVGFTLARRHPYRWPRFLAFEAILSLAFLNGRVWFLDPFSPRQIMSWILLSGSLALVVSGLSLIKTRGEPAGDIEETTRLITSGIYRWIRHPLYASLFLLAAGIYLKRPSWTGLLLVGLTLLGVIWTAWLEERHNLERFGEDYQAYMRETARFIPYIY